MGDAHHPAVSTPADAMSAMSAALLSDPPIPQCCCGREDCVFLKHNCSVLGRLEKDVHKAGELGQMLLVRHEAYMADAERDRVELTGRIDRLETDKSSLEAENAKTIEENRELLDQLEALNNTVSDSDVRITGLEAALKSSQLSVRRLEGAAAHAERLEGELEALMREQEKLQNDLFNSQRDARTTIQRWKTAERGISNLQQQLERMEQEALEERRRHAEVLERMERQRAVEKDLDTAAGRLKGAAAAKHLAAEGARNTSPVVSHFVRDLLQDNANLQLAIAELRELLENSNDEIQLLREQVMFHQPVVPEGENSATSTLRAELDLSIAEEEGEEGETSSSAQVPPHPPRLENKVSQELHIHHHYHVKAEPKKGKKKRQGLNANIFTPPSRSPSTPPSGQWRPGQASPGPALLSHAHRDSISTVPSNRWSVFSENPSDIAPSSVPTSPRSNRASVFGRGLPDEAFPTSPLASADLRSAGGWAFVHRKNASDASARSFQQPSNFPPPILISNLEPPSPRPQQSFISPQTTELTPESNANGLTPEGNATLSAATAEEVPDLTNVSTITDDSTDDPASRPSQHDVSSHPQFPSLRATHLEAEREDDLVSIMTPSTISTQRQRRPNLHRAASHESIMSLAGGLDIHTLKSRPSQLTLRHVGSMADTEISAVTASPVMSTHFGELGKRGSSTALRDSLAPWGLPIPRVRNASAGSTRPLSPASSAAGGTSSTGSTPRQSSALGRLAAWRPWGGGGGGSTGGGAPSSRATSPVAPRIHVAETEATSAPIAVPPPPPPKSPTTAASAAMLVAPTKSFRDRDFSRPTGINQIGAIPGFHEYFAAHQRRGPPSKIHPDVVDHDALRDGLEGAEAS